MKFLITGATGFVGGAIARKLLSSGHSVRMLVRAESHGRTETGPNVETISGDVTDAASVRRAVAGVDGVFHAAAIYSYWSRDSAATYRTNVDGTELVFKEAKAAGVPRVVLTSTVATLKWPGRNKLADETAVASIDDLPGHYKRSKLMAEEAALALNGHGFDVVVTNPTAPFGPGDARPTPTGRIVLEFLNHRFPGYVNTALNVCDVDDVAEGHLQAFARGRAGERYILGSENLSLRDLYDRLSEITGLRRRPVRVPFAMAFAAGVLDTLVEGKMLRREPFIPLEGLRVARHPMLVDCTKAVTELDLPRRSAASALRRSVDWFVQHRYTNARIFRSNPLENEDEAGIS